MPPRPIHALPSPDEMAGRLARVRERMAARALDAYVAFSPDNVFYLTNFANFVHERPFVLVISASGPPRFLVPRLEAPHVRSRAVGDIELVPYYEFPAPPADAWDTRLRALLPAGARVGVESVCPLQVYEAIPGERVRDDIVDDVRMIKSDYELGRIAYGCDIVSDAHERLLAGARPGRRLSEVSGELSREMMGRIVRDNPSVNMLATRFMAMFQPSSVSHDPHNFTNLDMAMEEGGPHVSVINVVVNGYGAEVERSFFLGHVPDAARKPFDVMMEARRTAFEHTVPGAIMDDVDARVQDVFERAGLAEFQLHRAGHGIGVTAHEGPFLARGYERAIEPGMVFTIEPGIYIPGIGGFRHSDTVMTTENGNLTLTRGPTSLEELTLPLEG